MKDSDKTVPRAIIIILLAITTFTYVLLVASNNRPLFAQIRLLGHDRTSTRDLITNQNITRGYIRTPGIQKSSLPTTFEQKEKSALNPQNMSAKTQNNIVNISSQFEKGPRIALVEPTFTAAAYNNSFYVFYQKYSHVSANTNITNDLNLLSSKIIKYPTITPTTNVHSAFAMLSLLKNFKLISPDSNITVLTDADVDNGSIFHNRGGSVDTNSNAYDVVILGHQEYVTQREYNYLKDFVSNGGTMFLLDGNVFYAQVKFDHNTNTVTLIKGHGWAYNGKSAWKSIAERWAKETSEWVGSNYLCYSCDITFANDPWEYQHHEEQYITNHNDKILMNYNAALLHYPIPSLKPVIATYELNYQKGKVVSLGIYSDDIITNKRFDNYLDNLVLQYSVQKQHQQGQEQLLGSVAS
jgi:hypothetical protein